MREEKTHLSVFIVNRMEDILRQWEAFAATQLPAAASMTNLALRDHARQILEAVALDLTTFQSSKVQAEKSKGLIHQAAGAPATAAQTHAVLRAISGFNISQLAAEYRALRASVLSLWLDENIPQNLDLQDVIRFNEAIDQALAESIECFTSEVTKQRNLFLGIIGHDLRNPVQSMQVTAQYLQALDATPEIAQAAQILMNGAARINALLDDLADYNRAKLGVGLSVKPTQCNLQQLFDEELEQIRILFRKRTINMDITGDTNGCWDGFRLKQVLSNLVFNAVKYGKRDTPIHIHVYGDQTTAYFDVVNEGSPIDPSTLEKIFDPLIRGTDQETAQTEGLGLGLFIVREIVNAHGGQIGADSQNSLTKFSIQLPRNYLTVS